MQPTADLPGSNPYGQTDSLRRAFERSLRAHLASGGGEISASVLLRAILEDGGCDGARALVALGVEPGQVAEAAVSEAPATPRHRADVSMVRFSTAASEGMTAGNLAARAEERPTATGDVVLGLLGCGEDWVARTAVSADGYQAALDRIEREP